MSSIVWFEDTQVLPNINTTIFSSNFGRTNSQYKSFLVLRSKGTEGFVGSRNSDFYVLGPQRVIRDRNAEVTDGR